jgi:site-specific DNA-methyltransferase (adenine-specific)
MRIFENKDCMEGMKLIADKSIDLIVTDPPYGSLNISWDKEQDYNLIFPEWFRICKDNAAILVFSHQPFATDVINASRKFFRYEIIWQKTQKTNFANAKKMPLRGHENILVFYKKLPTYNPQKYYSATGVRNRVKKGGKNGLEYEGYSGGFKDNYTYENIDGMMYPDSVVKFSNWNGALFGNTDHATVHPTQKPVDLIRYLIKTFSNPGETVFDGFAGSGTGVIACIQEAREYVAFELDKEYYDNAVKRIEQYRSQLKLF